jgi:redox-sensitive bicupin YhaK (pirin superfamily)
VSALPDAEPECLPTHDGAVDRIVRSRPRDVGGFAVRRALPARERRLVGPFVFWDHMGPTTFGVGQGIDVRPHPHINLATVTYLFEGEIVHKDSLGSDQAIVPGEVNWMTAGRGIVHSERSSAHERRAGPHVHGIQSWIALPLGDEEAEPAFHHHAAGGLPEFGLEGARGRVLVGSAYGVTSPVRVFSPTLYVEVRLDAGAEITLPMDYEERAVYVVDGVMACDGAQGLAGEMILVRPGAPALVRGIGGAHLMLLGGARLEEPRHIWWNFVSSTQERIERAKREWKEGRFPKVPGDEAEFIPLPE